MRIIPNENGSAWVQCGDIPICICESTEKAEIILDMLLEGIAAREELAEIKKTFMTENFDECVKAFEMHLLNKALCFAGHNQVRAARALGIKRTTLYEKAKRYGLLCAESGQQPKQDSNTAKETGVFSDNATEQAGAGDSRLVDLGFDSIMANRAKDADEISKQAATIVFQQMEREKNNSGN